MTLQPGQTEQSTLAALPEGWADDRTDDTLWATVSRALIDEAPSLSPHTVKKRRNDWLRLREALEPAGVNTVEDWLDPEGRRLAFDSLRAAAARGDLGQTVATLDTRLSSLRWGLKMAGLSPEILQRVKTACRQVCVASGIRHEAQPVLDAGHARAVVATLDEWQARPVVKVSGNHMVHDGVRIHHGSHGKPWRIAQLRLFSLLQMTYGIRFGDVASLRWRDLDQHEARWSISKGHRFPKPASAEMRPLVWAAAQEWAQHERHTDGAPDTRIFCSHERTLHGDIRALCIAADLPAKVGGHYGLHRFRAGIATAAIEAGLPTSDAAAALGHTKETTAAYYTGQAGIYAGRGRTLDTWTREFLPALLSPNHGGTIDAAGAVHLDAPITGPDGNPYVTLYPSATLPPLRLSDSSSFARYAVALGELGITPESVVSVTLLGTLPWIDGGGFMASAYLEMNGEIVTDGGVTLTREGGPAQIRTGD